MKAPKTVYVCSECDGQFPRWSGQCPSCRAWNTLTEETYRPQPKQSAAVKRVLSKEIAVPFSEMEDQNSERIITGIGELDRVLGGGLVPGSAVLLAGEPGIGKSTLLMQLCGKADDNYSVLYVSGEESKGQLKLRAKRLGVDASDVLVLTENDLDTVINEYDRVSPDVVIVDSVQTMVSASADSSAGSITQVRECSSQLVARAKADGAAIILVGHVNKEGGIAGPKVLEHMVDAVLYFEGDRSQSHRIVRAIKNRYGSTNEIGVFEMTDTGLDEVDNPSAMLLAGRPKGVSGSCAVCLMEGTRPIIAEIQALTTPTAYPTPKRMADGIDYNRMCLLLAVLEKRLGLKFSQCDVYLNVIGGLRIDEPAADAAIAMALTSSFKDIPVPADLIVAGEIGLSGEVRAVSCAEQRAKEAERIGFKKIALPKRSIQKKPMKLTEAEVVPVSGIYDFAVILSNAVKELEK
ncbi:MAG: DNA repair protein RadA [Clostridia bacterium]|nr:DNA repair protein RadA [Clostridia bacterium]